jgi:hypothetical protein
MFSRVSSVFRTVLAVLVNTLIRVLRYVLLSRLEYWREVLFSVKVVSVQAVLYKEFRNLPSVPEYAAFSQAVHALVDFREEIISNS